MPYGEGYQYTYVIKGDAFKRTEINYEDNYSIINWNQEYNIDDFNHIKFMTTKEFYDKYKDSYEKIIEILYEKKLNNKLSDFGRKPYEDMIDKLILPETKYLIKSKSFNL